MLDMMSDVMSRRPGRVEGCACMKCVISDTCVRKRAQKTHQATKELWIADERHSLAAKASVSISY